MCVVMRTRARPRATTGYAQTDAILAHVTTAALSPPKEHPGRLNSELVVVVLALVPAILCILAFVGIVCLCFCYRKKGKALSRKELDRDEEADQLAAGD